MKFEKYTDARNEWRWRLQADNGKTIADSGEGYSSERACDHGIDLVKTCASAPVAREAAGITRPKPPSQRPLPRPDGSVKLTRPR